METIEVINGWNKSGSTIVKLCVATQKANTKHDHFKYCEFHSAITYFKIQYINIIIKTVNINI